MAALLSFLTLLVVSPADLDVGYAYMGVSCAEPNSIACDRVGIFVSTEQTPDHLIATVAGHSVRLDDPGWHRDGAASFEGFLEAPGLLHDGQLAVATSGSERWLGSPTVEAPIRIEAFDETGQPVGETLLPSLQLSAGYG
jgi:hypothetical protein